MCCIATWLGGFEMDPCGQSGLSPPEIGSPPVHRRGRRVRCAGCGWRRAEAPGVRWGGEYR